MIIFMVIPYILGIITTPNYTTDERIAEYTFQVDVTWWFFDFNHLKENIHLSVDLKCHQVGFDLLCRLENWRVWQQVPKRRYLTLPGSLYIKRISDQEALQNDNRSFQIVFNQRGVAGYFLEGKAVPRRMMNLYRVIGNQLNIGVDIQKETGTFEDVEQSNVGSCVVKCTKIMQEPTIFGAVDKLIFFAGRDLEHNTITIVKQKILSQCAVLTERLVTASFWPNLFPKTATSYVLNNSVSSMTMSSRNFETLTENEYHLYDKDKNIVGNMSEGVKLYLKSYRLLPPDSFIPLNKDKIVFYKVLNEEAA